MRLRKSNVILREVVRPPAVGMLSRSAGREMGGEIRRKKQMRFDRKRRNSTGNLIISRLSTPCRLVLSTKRHPAEPHLFFSGSPHHPSQCPAPRESIPTAGGIYVMWGAKRQKIRTARGYAGCSFIMRGEIVLSGSSTICNTV